MVRKGIAVEMISILWTLVEAGIGIAAGLAAHSLALLVFGIDSIIELVAGVVLLWRLCLEFDGKSIKRIKQAEKGASRVVGSALLLLAVYISAAAAYHLCGRSGAETNVPGIILAVFAGVVMPVLAQAKKKIGNRIGSSALKSDGACSMVCAYMSWVLLIGVVLTALLHWWWIDSVVSLAFVYFVVKEGLEALEEARAA